MAVESRPRRRRSRDRGSAGRGGQTLSGRGGFRLRPAARRPPFGALSKTPAYWARPAMPLGSHPPQWPMSGLQSCMGVCPRSLPTPIVVDVTWAPPLMASGDETAGRSPCGSRNARVKPRTSDQILGEIRDYCRATQTAESTFGRLVVNDGKLVSRLRDGARITTGTLDKVRAYLSEHRSASSPSSEVSADHKPGNGAVAAATRRPPASGSSTTARSTCCSSRPAARRPTSPTEFRSNSESCSRRLRRCGSSTPASAMAPCCRG